MSTTLLGGLILKRLILLSQLSPGGHREANKLVDKILKSVTDRKPLGNPSAFTTTGVENARKLLTPKGEYYAAKAVISEGARPWGVGQGTDNIISKLMKIKGTSGPWVVLCPTAFGVGQGVLLVGLDRGSYMTMPMTSGKPHGQ